MQYLSLFLAKQNQTFYLYSGIFSLFLQKNLLFLQRSKYKQDENKVQLIQLVATEKSFYFLIRENKCFSTTHKNKTQRKCYVQHDFDACQRLPTIFLPAVFQI